MVLYLLERQSKAKKSSGRIIIEKAGKRVASLPITHMEQAVIGGHAQMTTEAAQALMESGCRITYVNWQGKVTGVIETGRPSAKHISRQVALFADERARAILARELIRMKAASEIELLRQFSPKNKSEIKSEVKSEVKAAIDEIKSNMNNIEGTDDIDALRGIEGITAKIYFAAFHNMIAADGWTFTKRSRRPARDPVNALMNYGYAFLEREVRVAIAGSGLDCRIGFMHANNGRKDSLVYDMMELFRASVTDRFVLRLINYGKVSKEDFRRDEDYGYMLTDGARREWIQEYEAAMQRPLKRYDGKSTRDHIREQTEKFLNMAISMKVDADTDAKETKQHEKNKGFKNSPIRGILALCGKFF